MNSQELDANMKGYPNDPSVETVKIYCVLKASPDNWFTTKKLSELTGVSPRTTRARLHDLWLEGTVEQEEHNEGRSHAYIYTFEDISTDIENARRRYNQIYTE